MLKDLIYDQKKIHSTDLHRSDPIKAVLRLIDQNGNLETAVLLFEGEAQSFLLFIFQDRLYATYKLTENQVMPLPFSDYLKEMSQAEGPLDLYRVSPVLFKALLSLGQMEPKISVSSDLIDIERLLSRIAQKKEETFLLLKGEEQVNLFYFLEGDLCDGYLEETEEMREETDLRDKLLVYAYSSQEKPVSILLYEEIAISPANDCESAAERISAQAITGEEISFDKSSHSNNLLEKESSNIDGFSNESEHDLWLEVLNGERGGLLIRFASESLSLGRGRVDVRLNDPQISRYHAELKRSQFGLIVTDQHSTNGLFVNDKKVTKKEVELNDIIRLGDTCLKVIHAK